MEIRRCDKGHFFDAEANATCPQCAVEAGMVGGGMPNSGMPSGATPSYPGSGMENYGATEPAAGAPMNMKGGAEMPKSSMPSGEIGATMPVGDMTGGMAMTGNSEFQPAPGPVNNMGVEDYSDATQPVIVGGIAGFTPVAGWLVCVEGPSRGADYRIRAGYNYIGRGEHMDICIRGDQKIGRERHALIAYDQEERVFFFGPADGKSIVRINGKMIMTPTEIHAYDTITIGTTKLLFVPFCGDNFDWN